MMARNLALMAGAILTFASSSAEARDSGVFFLNGNDSRAADLNEKFKKMVPVEVQGQRAPTPGAGSEGNATLGTSGTSAAQAAAASRAKPSAAQAPVMSEKERLEKARMERQRRFERRSAGSTSAPTRPVPRR